jgi:hypothetical protein
VLGLIGYIVASVTLAIVGRAVDLDAPARLVAVVMPAVGFVVAVLVNRVVLREERIVFYQASFGAWLAACLVAWCTEMPVAIVSDLVILLVAIFNAFGRIGCLHVACCHGRPARIGVHYRGEHVVLGFPRRWLGRTIFPVQLVESLVSAALAVACAFVILSDHPPGTATCVFVTAYALMRFPLELARGDGARPYFKGLSEAQWIALGTTLLVGISRPNPWVITAFCLLLVMAIAVLATARGAFARGRHLDEIERTVAALVRQNKHQAALTSSGLKLSARTLPDGTVDVICSHAALTQRRLEHVAATLYAQPRIVPGTTAGLFHVLVPRDQFSHLTRAREAQR